jgi:hypothetical protein
MKNPQANTACSRSKEKRDLNLDLLYCLSERSALKLLNRSATKRDESYPWITTLNMKFNSALPKVDALWLCLSRGILFLSNRFEAE